MLELELVLADAATVDSQIDKRRKAARVRQVPGRRGGRPGAGPGRAARPARPIYRSSLPADDRALLEPFFLLTNKPVLAVVNLGEDQVGRRRRDRQAGGRRARRGTATCSASASKLEAEAAQLDPEERVELLEGLGLGEGALPRVARAAYHLLGRRTFLTTGDKESRAWTFRAGAKAPECAGVIHSDLQRGFIRAEVIRWDELLRLGSWHAAKEAGKLRVEGKDYEVVDGDVLEIRFNV